MQAAQTQRLNAFSCSSGSYMITV